MKLSNMLDDDILNDMDLSDALFVLSELAADNKLTETEINKMTLFIEDLSESETDLSEMHSLPQHSDTITKRTATFKKSKSSDRIKNRLKQRIRRRSSSYKIQMRNKRRVSKKCKGNTTAQLVKSGGNVYACKPKNRFKSKLMKRVAKAYNR